MKSIDTNSLGSYTWKIFIYIFLTALFFPMFAQQSAPSNTRNQAKANNTTNFYKIQKEMEDYWDSKVLIRVNPCY